ncbi:MAG: hypothetical protein OQJ96_01385 [Flavobacteriales bacterium]|nr:hypothetical protein [Flavobacteriales bacterium]MCW8938180.1 hypothetical protein [Flavobacteriales bacterium]MCW8967028.1 hypothetical protein [Flavobacteriales bacterium]MCW8991522.1 hypothetical protein [Flavobacteriales bacterium]MCW9018921.1 hypothetical protein [Flavobacteriales bacterium]
MDYHTSLQPIVEFIQELTFKEEDREIHYVRPFPEQNTVLIYESEIYNSCNGYHFDEFNKKIKEIVREIEDKIDNDLISKGSDYKKEIRQIVKSLNRLIQDLFNDYGSYTERTIYLNDNPSILEMKIDGTYINYVCNKYKCEPQMIYDTRNYSKPTEFYKLIHSRLINLEQCLSFIYTEVHNITDSVMNQNELLERIDCKLNPSQFGFIMIKFVENGYITLPQVKGKGSISRLAQLFHKYFKISGSVNNEQCSLGTLEKEFNDNSNSLTHINSSKFSNAKGEFILPHIDNIK